MSIYEHIKKLLHQRAITVKDMCRALNINYGSYNTGRSRNSLPRLDDAYSIAQFLGVSLDYLYTGKELQPDLDYPNWHSMSDKKKFMVRQIALLNDDNARLNSAYDMLYLESLEQQANAVQN